MADPFISVSDLGDYLGRDLSADDAAQIAVEGACDIVRTITGQLFDLEATDTINLDGTGTDTLILPARPVNSVTSVTENDQALVADDDYKLDSNGALYRMPTVDDCNVVWRTWRCGRQNIQVVYSHGYLPQDLPHDIRQVALNIASRLLGQRSGVSFESLGEYSVRYEGSSADLSSTEKIILRKYKVAL